MSDAKEAKRAQILHAATNLFASKGLSGTRMADVASLAKMSHGLVYHYFPSKEAIFEALIDESLREATQALVDAASSGTTGFSRIEAFLRLQYEMLQDDARNSARMQIFRSLHLDGVPEDVTRRLQSHLEQIRENIVRWVTDGQRDGSIGDEGTPCELGSYLLIVLRGVWLRPPVKLTEEIPLPRIEHVLHVLAPSRPANPSNRKG